MPSPLQASVLVAVYNHEPELRRTLLGLAAQTRRDFEVLLCDDGSGPAIAALARELRPLFPGGLRHLWQPDAGFRKCRILNAGVRRAGADYLVVLDADCVPHHAFVAAHLAARRPGHYLAGRRVELDAPRTARLAPDLIRRRRLDRLIWRSLPGLWSGELRHLEAAFWLPPGWPVRPPKRKRNVLLGCNFSCWKADLERINGFDEEFTTPGGGEDTDVERRFALADVRPLSVKHRAICYHQWHPLVPRGTAGAELCRRRAAEGRATCPRGLADPPAADVAELA